MFLSQSESTILYESIILEIANAVAVIFFQSESQW